MQTSLEDKKWVVIGGTTGIGFAAAKMAAHGGAVVTLTGRDEGRVERAVANLGPRARGAVFDFSNEEDTRAFFEGCSDLDHVLVTAGSTKLGGLLNEALDDHVRPILTRVGGSIAVVRAAAQRMKTDGSFTFVGGLSTDRPVLGAPATGVATAAAEQLARVLALDLAPLRFNALSPGYTDTPMWDQVFGREKEAVLNELGSKLPLKRVVSAEEVAMAALFLASNPAVTGEIIHVDGGGRLV